jgi:hypothetical protein
VRLLAALALAAVVLSGCETTAEKSAKLEAAAKRSGTASRTPSGSGGLRISRPSTVVKVLTTALVHSSEGTAAVVQIRNTSAVALRDVPIEITVRGAHGSAIYSNTAPGLGPALISVSSIPARGELTWVDDQIQAAGVPASVTAVVGQSPASPTAPPRLEVRGMHLGGEGSASGTLVNRSSIAQREVVVYAVARRGARVVAAGRAVLPDVRAGASVPFQLFFIGDPKGAHLQAGACATTVG